MVIWYDTDVACEGSPETLAGLEYELTDGKASNYTTGGGGN
jgi:hypothetical protein